MSEIIKQFDETPESLEEKLLANYEYESFWSMLKKRCKDLCHPYIEAAFLRDLPVERRLDLFKSIFHDMVLCTEDASYISDQLSLTKEYCYITVRLLNTAARFIIEDNCTKRYFESQLWALVRLSTPDSELLWNLFYDNKEELRYRFLFRKLNRHEDSLDQLEHLIISPLDDCD